tara:strand:- start:26 stop:241 length:216 start_codon:yes stop_codon:yes gene_type:complete
LQNKIYVNYIKWSKQEIKFREDVQEIVLMCVEEKVHHVTRREHLHADTFQDAAWQQVEKEVFAEKLKTQKE